MDKMQTITALTPLVAMGLTWVVGKVVPKIPRATLPVVSGVIGGVVGLCAQYGAQYDGSLLVSVLLGLAGSGLYEFQKAVKSMGKSDPTPAVVVVVAAMAVSLVGCVTPGKPNWQAMGPLFETAAYTGTRVYLNQNPSKSPIFKSTVGLLDALVKDPEVNAAKFATALQGLPIKELQDPTATIIIGSAVILWDSYKSYIPVGAQEQAAVVRPLVQRVRNGIGLALGMEPILVPAMATRERIGTGTPELVARQAAAPKAKKGSW